MKYGKIIIIAAAVVACSAQETAKDAYTVQSKACLVAYTAAADQQACLASVRGRWTEAGAPPAATTDGGAP